MCSAAAWVNRVYWYLPNFLGVIKYAYKTYSLTTPTKNSQTATTPGGDMPHLSEHADCASKKILDCAGLWTGVISSTYHPKVQSQSRGVRGAISAYHPPVHPAAYTAPPYIPTVLPPGHHFGTTLALAQ